MSKDLTKPTPNQIVHRHRELAKHLFANKRKARGKLRDDSGGRCCLGVAEDYAISCGLKIERSPAGNSEPPEEVGQFFGWTSDEANPELVAPDGNKYTASELNDGLGEEYGKTKHEVKGLTHAQIAECFINTFVTPKRPKWSFTLSRSDA